MTDRREEGGSQFVGLGQGGCGVGLGLEAATGECDRELVREGMEYFSVLGS